MDLPYLRAHPEHLPTFLHHQRIRETPVSGGSVAAASRLTLDDGSSIFTKSWPEGSTAPDGYFAAEAAGLAWLRSAEAIGIPQVLVALPSMIAMEWLEPGPASRAAAERLGRELAALHRSGADFFGAPWSGFIGPLPLDNTPTTGAWGPWFAQRRLLPYLRISADRGALTAGDVAVIEEILQKLSDYAHTEPPSRTHGDLWPGNVLWAEGDRAWLVDPAAQGAHRETDLAELALFGGSPHLAATLAAYQEVYPLAEGWPERIPVHQLHLLLVHTAAFGESYRSAVRAAADAFLRSA